MNRKKVFLVLSMIFVLLPCLWSFLRAGDLNPPGMPTSGTMKTMDEVESRIPLNQSNTPGTTTYVYRITQSGSYILTGNLLVAVNKGGIRIEADDVTLDLQGHSIECTYATSGYHGIYFFTNRKNVTVKNGTVKGFYSGLSCSGANTAGIQVFGIRAVDNDTDGISLYGYTSDTYSGGGFLVRECVAEDNGAAGIDAGSGSVVLDCVAKANGGIGIYNGSQGVIKNCLCYYNTTSGINANSGSIVENNICKGNGSAGIFANAGSTVRGNTSNDNGTYGINAAEGSVVIENVTYGNQSHGISTGMGVTIKNNTSYENGSSGIYLSSWGCTVVGNSVRRNQNYGIYAGGQSLVDQNTAYDNNLSGGSYVNLYAAASCTVGLNHAP